MLAPPRTRKRSCERKKYHFPFAVQAPGSLTGPPMVPPKSFSMSLGRCGMPNWRALSDVFLRNSNSEPWSSLLPAFVTAVTTPDEVEPYCGSTFDVNTLTSLIASGENGLLPNTRAAPVCVLSPSCMLMPSSTASSPDPMPPLMRVS